MHQRPERRQGHRETALFVLRGSLGRLSWLRTLRKALGLRAAEVAGGPQDHEALGHPEKASEAQDPLLLLRRIRLGDAKLVEEDQRRAQEGVANTLPEEEEEEKSGVAQQDQQQVAVGQNLQACQDAQKDADQNRAENCSVSIEDKRQREELQPPAWAHASLSVYQVYQLSR